MDDDVRDDDLAAATKADLKSHFDEMQRFLFQMKNELLAEQKRVSECTFLPVQTDAPIENAWEQAPRTFGEDASSQSCEASIPSRTSIRASARFKISPDRHQMAQSFSQLARATEDRSRKKASTVSKVAVAITRDCIREQSKYQTEANIRQLRKQMSITADSTLSEESFAAMDDDDSSRCQQLRLRFEEFIQSTNFDAACGIVIFLNAVLLGVETEYLAQDGETPKECEVLQGVVNGWYIVELCLRAAAERRAFFIGHNRNWNVLDSVLAISTIVDLFVTVSWNSLKNASIWRAARLLRIVKTLRILRQFKNFREFRKMVVSFSTSVHTLFWSMLLVFGVMYGFALWFTQRAAYYRIDRGDNASDRSIIMELDKYYSSFSRTVFSLFAAIAGGYSWHQLVDPWIAARSHLTVFLFLVYVSLSVFGLMNIVTSIFVESAMSATKYFQELLVDERKKDLEMYTRHMQNIFHVIDTDGGGTISFKEMADFLDDDSSELGIYLEALGITLNDVWVLFRLLDEEDTGHIDIVAFCSGCMRLKGEARSFDINCMMYEHRAMCRRHERFMAFAEDKFGVCEELFQNLSRRIPQLFTDLDRRFAARIVQLLPDTNPELGIPYDSIT